MCGEQGGALGGGEERGPDDGQMESTEDTAVEYIEVQLEKMGTRKVPCRACGAGENWVGSEAGDSTRQRSTEDLEYS